MSGPREPTIRGRRARYRGNVEPVTSGVRAGYIRPCDTPRTRHGPAAFDHCTAAPIDSTLLEVRSGPCSTRGFTCARESPTLATRAGRPARHSPEVSSRCASSTPEVLDRPSTLRRFPHLRKGREYPHDEGRQAPRRATREWAHRRADSSRRRRVVDRPRSERSSLGGARRPAR